MTNASKYLTAILILFSHLSLFAQDKGLFVGNVLLQNLLDSTIYYKWDKNSETWIPKWKETNILANNKINQTTGFEFDSVSFIWKNSWKYIYTYNSNNKVNQWTSNDWVNNTWVNYCRADYSYNSNNKISQILGYDFYAQTMAWVKSWKEDYTYDNNQNLTKWEIVDWLYTTNNWRNSWKAEYSYINDALSQYIYSDWDTVSNVWNQYEKGIYVYYPETDVIERTVYEFSNSVWVIVYREIYSNTKSSDLKIRYGYEWDSELFMWTFAWKYEYYWSDMTNGFNESQTNGLKVFPNPVKNIVNVFSDEDFDEVELYNSLGQKLNVSELIFFQNTSNIQLDLSSLQSGVYFIKVICNDKVIGNQSVIKQ